MSKYIIVSLFASALVAACVPDETQDPDVSERTTPGTPGTDAAGSRVCKFAGGTSLICCRMDNTFNAQYTAGNCAFCGESTSGASICTAANREAPGQVVIVVPDTGGR